MDEKFPDMTDLDTALEREWEKRHAGKNSARCYEIAIAELRRKYEAGEPILSAEYGPQQAAAERALHDCEAA